ncbi:MAG: YciI family protein [Cyclobacteriaceae bacterium]
MRLSLYILSLLIAVAGCQPNQQNSNQSTDNSAEPTAGYDSLLAAEVGVDAYGMRAYVMAFLKRGPNRDLDSLEAVNLQRAHMDNIQRLAKEGTLVLAGPFMDDGDVRGIYVFAVATVAEAEALTATDPAIQAGSLVMELHPWYGSAAMMKLNEYYPRIAKEQI